jgi:hypothetical protein
VHGVHGHLCFKASGAAAQARRGSAVDGDVPDGAGESSGAVVRAAVDDQPDTNTSAVIKDNCGACTPGFTRDRFCQRGGLGEVAHRHWYAKQFR